ncbi:hypothetical protein AVEN_75385-1 [Araneus ventricosus]|uniref:Uncharacterized protein n=1 Tax=Araneus ventricosus TaxID=182803 RepID=A0A4Y2HWX3_ARAVE|nr:hypothetical protein AVEN_75385-1 [Araneus ventricosus]
MKLTIHLERGSPDFYFVSKYVLTQPTSDYQVFDRTPMLSLVGIISHFCCLLPIVYLLPFREPGQSSYYPREDYETICIVVAISSLFRLAFCWHGAFTQ